MEMKQKLSIWNYIIGYTIIYHLIWKKIAFKALKAIETLRQIDFLSKINIL